MALKQISPTQVELGMFVHSFQGSWLRHPFWRARFLVNDDDKLRTLRDCELDAIVIDTDRGIDVATRAPAQPPRAVPVRQDIRSAAPRRETPIMAPSRQPGIAAARPAAGGVTREFGNARRTVGQARKVISKVFIEARLGKAPRVAEVAPVVEDIHASIERNAHAFSGLMRCKTEMEAIYQHMLSTSALMVSLARAMKLSPHETRLAGMAGLLLDVGVSRLDIDAGVLSGGLDSVDRDLWERHCFVGRDLLAAADDVPEEVLHAVLCHHEQMDGAGFPQRLEGRQIDIFSRMAAICDRFDLIVSGAVTGHAVDPAEAMRMMMQAGNAFDGDVLAHFQEAIGVYPVGSFVTLRSGRIAMVVDQDPADPTLPTVRAFYSIASSKYIAAKTIALANCFGEDAIEGIAELTGLGLPEPADLREQLFGAAARA